MPWPKGKPFSPIHIARRSASLRASGKRRKKPDDSGRWKCCTCQIWKFESEYHPDNRTSNGLKPQCKKCHQKTSVMSRDPEKYKANKRMSEARRRARKSGAEGEISKQALSELEGKFGSACLLCGTDETLQWDHVIPLARGGSHCVTNLQRLCRKCNEIKQARDYDYRTEEHKVWVLEFKGGRW